MKVKTVRIFLVYDKSSYWLYYPILGMKQFMTRFFKKWFVCAHRPHTESIFNARRLESRILVIAFFLITPELEPHIPGKSFGGKIQMSLCS